MKVCMKILSVTRSMDEMTFEPSLRITLDLPITLMQDKKAVLTEEELESFVGKMFLGEFTNYRKVNGI